MKKLTAKRILAGFLTVLMLATLMPTTVYAAEHTHEWAYSPASRSAIMATCADADGACPTPTVTISLSAPTSAVYDGSAKEVTIHDLPQGTSATPYYYDENGAVLSGAPKDPGSYSASISIGGVTASVEFNISSASVSSVTLDVTAPVAGQAPQTAVLAGTGYTATILWTPADSTFLYNTAYTATVTLSAKAGYSFDADLSVDGWTKSGTA